MNESIGEFVEIEKLVPWADNPRENEAAIDAVARSIERFGFASPIIARRQNNEIIAGHTRYKAAQRLSLRHVPVVYVDLNPVEAHLLALADNKIGEKAEWDTQALSDILKSLDDDGADMEGVGFSDSELSDMLRDAGDVGLTDPDEIPETPDEATTEVGDIWQLGDHRLMCGDSTCADDVSSLMLDCVADICFTSPPYNVGRTPNGDAQKYADCTDDRHPEEYRQFLNSFVTLALEHSDFVFSNIQSVAGNKKALIEHLFDMRNFFSDTMIWDKQNAEPAMAERVMNSRFEYVHVFSKEAKRTIGTRKFRGTIDNVISLSNRDSKEFASVHKATFHVDLPSFFIENFSVGAIYDPFCGSGTTLIACEKSNRTCYAMEISPLYCDVIIRRWENFTGETAVLVSN